MVEYTSGRFERMLQQPRVIPARQWRALLVAMVFPTFATWLYFMVFAGSEWMQFVYGVLKLVQFAAPLIWVVWVEHRASPFEELIQQSPRQRSTLWGLLLGLAIGGAIWAGYRWIFAGSPWLDEMARAVREKLFESGITAVERYVALALFYSIVHSLLEEYYWRWFVFARLRELVPLWAAVLVSSLAFGAHHVLVLAVYCGGFTPLAFGLAGGVAVGGALWALLYDRSHSLYGPWASHLLVDAAIMAVGYDMIWPLAV